MMNSTNISCELHDYIEVACMYSYQLRLVLKDNQVFEGKAIDIITSAENTECLLIDSGGIQQHIALIQLAKMQVITPNAKFNEVIF